MLSASEVAGAPGTAVQIRGSGFAAASTVTLTIEGRTIAVTSAGNSGGFAVAVRIPAGLARGDELLVASDREGTQAHVPFIVLGPLRGRVVDIAIGSRALSGEVHARVYLPPGYSTSRLAYPVLYFLHGLPGTSQSYTVHAVHVAELAELVSAQAIVVLPQGCAQRRQRRGVQ